MKKLFKILAITVAVIVLLALTATTLLGLFVDPNDYKKEIQQVALEQADLELQINGDISWSIYPSIGLNIQSISAGYANKEALASLEKAQVSVMVAPLFSGNIEMKAINIHGLKLNLIKNKDTNNWQNTPSADQEASSTQNDTANKQSESTPAIADDSSSTVNKIDIQSISVTSAAINYLDKTNGQLFKVNNFNLVTNRVQSGQPFNAKLDLDLAMEQSGKQTLSSNVALEGLFNLDMAKQKYTIDQLNSQLKVITDKTIDVQLKGNLAADLNSNQLSINDLAISTGTLSAAGALDISGDAFQDIQGTLAVKAFDLKALLEELKLAPITTSNDASLRSIAFSTDLKGDAKGLNLNNLSLNIDKTEINGSASYQLSNGAIGFNLNGDKINVSDYLPSAAPATNKPASTNTTQKPTTKTKTSTAYSKEQIIPVAVLRDLKLKGQLNFNQLQYQQTKLTNLALNVNANNGVVNIAKLNMNAYQGSIASSVHLDARKEPLRIKVKNKVSNLQIGPVLQHFAQTDAMTGALSSSSQLALSGQSVHSLVNSLTGKVNVTLAKGVINGINAAQEMCQTVNSISSLGGTVGTTQAVDKSTPFASIKGIFNIKNGVVSNSDFNADLDAINVKGKGKVNLPKQSLDYRLGLNIKDNLFNKSCSVNNKIQGIEWPVDCKGKFSDDPLKLCKLDTSIIEKIAKKALEDKLKKKLEKKLGGSIKEKTKALKQKVEEKVQDKLKNALKGLF